MFHPFWLSQNASLSNFVSQTQLLNARPSGDKFETQPFSDAAIIRNLFMETYLIYWLTESLHSIAISPKFSVLKILFILAADRHKTLEWHAATCARLFNCSKLQNSKLQGKTMTAWKNGWSVD